MRRAIALWAAVAAADRASVSERAGLARLVAGPGVGRPDRATLVTCHRVEAYGVAEVAGAPDPLPEALMGFPVVLAGEDAVRHLFRLAVGLESAVLGEDQVLHRSASTVRT